MANNPFYFQHVFVLYSFLVVLSFILVIFILFLGYFNPWFYLPQSQNVLILFQRKFFVNLLWKVLYKIKLIIRVYSNLLIRWLTDTKSATIFYNWFSFYFTGICFSDIWAYVFQGTLSLDFQPPSIYSGILWGSGEGLVPLPWSGLVPHGQTWNHECIRQD